MNAGFSGQLPIWLIVGALVAAAAGCRGSQADTHPAASTANRPSQSLARADPLLPVTLPADDAPHQMLTEWWYYTGHLESGDGQPFGFEFVVFQTIRGPNPVGYLSHFAVTDVAANRFAYDARSLTSEQVPTTLALDVGDWALIGGGGQDHFKASMADYDLELDLSTLKPAALHHDGLISFGAAGDSYYFSRTRMAATGGLRRGDSWVAVTGEAWHDHQWGNFIVPTVGGWDWISIQLADNRELMVTVLRGSEGQAVGAFGSFVDADGRTADVPSTAIQVDATGSWTSPRSGVRYPSGWMVGVEASAQLPAMSFSLSPVLLDQELAFDRTAYWEGAVEVVGAVEDQQAVGRGYVELTGYGP